MKRALKGPTYHKKDYVELLSLLYQVFRLAKTKGMLALEQHVEKPDESALFAQFPNVQKNHHAVEFLCDYLRMMTLGTENANEVETLIDAEACCWGFWEGMELRPGSWDEIWDSEVGELMRLIYLLGADEIEEDELPEVENPRKAHQLALEIEANLPAIHKFWVPRRKPAVETVKREEPKVGRNDVCPCGSGKKYKKCHGAQEG